MVLIKDNMEKLNWKKELKQSGLDFIDGAYSLLCMAIIAGFILYCQTEQCIHALNIIIQPPNWLMIFLLITGIAMWGMALRLIFTGLFNFIVFIIRMIIRTNTKNKSNGNTISTKENQ